MGKIKTLLTLRTSITKMILLCLLAIVSASSLAREAKSFQIEILAFGDSLTAGYTLPVQDSYPAQLEKLLKQKGFPVVVTNAGVSGDTSEQGRRRVAWVLKQKNYDFVLLGLGANDGLRQLPLDLLEKNLNLMIEEFEKAGLRVVLLGMKMPGNFERKYRESFAKVYERISKRPGILYFPFLLEGVATRSELNLDDQIHPNARGYNRIAENLAAFLIPHLNEFKNKKNLAVSR